ncbi:MAG: hypothetical protein ACK4UJ_06725 [Leptonema sp. (in: bacteria)]
MQSGYLLTSQYFKNAGTIWFILGIFVSFIGDLELSFFIFKTSEFFWFGKLKPFYSNILIFGSIVSYFLSSVYWELESLKIDQKKPQIIANLVFAIYQSGLVFGLITILFGKMEGRLYGEMNFISDNLILLSLTVVLVQLLIHSKKTDIFSEKLQFLVVILTGMIVTFFLGNFGFPNSYITTVPPTSGYQDAMVTEFYKNSISIFFVLFPLIFLVYSTLGRTYNIQEESNLLAFLMIISVLIPFTSGSNLGLSPYQNFWTHIGNYLLSGILVLVLGILYLNHNLYNKNKTEPLLVFTVIGILLSLFVVFLLLSNLPILQKYFQFTVMDSSEFAQKLIFTNLPIFIMYNAVFYNDKRISKTILYLVLIFSILAFLFYLLEGIVTSKSFFSLNDQGELLIKEWSNIIEKEKIFITLRIFLEVVMLFGAFYLIKYPLGNKINQGAN